MSRYRGVAQAKFEPDFPEPERSWTGPISCVLRAGWLVGVWLATLSVGGIAFL